MRKACCGSRRTSSGMRDRTSSTFFVEQTHWGSSTMEGWKALTPTEFFATCTTSAPPNSSMSVSFSPRATHRAWWRNSRLTVGARVKGVFPALNTEVFSLACCVCRRASTPLTPRDAPRCAPREGRCIAALMRSVPPVEEDSALHGSPTGSGICGRPLALVGIPLRALGHQT